MEEEGHFVAWAVTPDVPSIAVTKPFDGKPATVGNGVMVALSVDTSEKVNAFYKKAIELGATDEGKPSPRARGQAVVFMPVISVILMGINLMLFVSLNNSVSVALK